MDFYGSNGLPNSVKALKKDANLSSPVRYNHHHHQHHHLVHFRHLGP